MNPKTGIFVLLLCTIAIVSLNCTNPFAPKLGEPGGTSVPDAGTIGGMLELFKYAYNTKDSLIYSTLLDSSFVFQYYDSENSIYDQWYRTSDLKATGGLFRSFNIIDLYWYNIPSTLWTIDTSDSTVDFKAYFNLSLDNTVVTGFARFDCYKKAGSTFKITAWHDDF